MALSAAEILEHRFGVTLPGENVLTHMLASGTRTALYALPDGALYRQMAGETDSGSGVDVTDKRVLKLKDADGYTPMQLPLEDVTLYNAGKGAVAAMGSSAWYISANTAYILNYGGTAGGTIYTLSVPTITESATSVSGWPTDFLELACCATAIELKERDLRLLRSELPSLITSPTAPTAPSAPAISYSDATAATVSATTISALPTVPTYTDGTGGSKPSAPSIGNLTLSASAPTAPTLTDVDLDISGLSFPSTPSWPSLSLSYTPHDTYYGEEDPEMMEATLRRLDRQIEEFLADTKGLAEQWLGEIRAYREQWEALVADENVDLAENETDVRLYAAQVQGYAAEVRAEVDAYLANLRADIDAYRAEGDIELGFLRASIEQEVHTLKPQLDDYQREVDRLIEQARLTHQEAAQNAQMSTDVSVQNELRTMEAAYRDYELELQRFRYQLELYAAEATIPERVFNTTMERFKTKVITFQREKKELESRLALLVQTYTKHHARMEPSRVVLYDV